MGIWRETYGAIAPPGAVRALDVAHRLAYWQGTLGRAGTETVIAEDAVGIVGLVSCGPASTALFGNIGEVRHLYVARRARGRGLGRTLLGVALQALGTAGHHRAGLAVVADNAAARRFYRLAGGTETTAFRDPGPLWRSENILVTWPLAPTGAY